MIYVCYTADSNYAMQVAVSMVSMLENNKENTIEFFILADQYQDNIKNKFKTIENKYKTKINIIDISEKLKSLMTTALIKEKGIVKNNMISYMFARLFIGSSIPSYVSKIIYIDCDTLYIDNILELYNTEITNEYVFAAVRDLWPSSYNRVIGFDESEAYFQSGILLIDLKKWRFLECEKEIIEYVNSLNTYLFMHDQDILNICFRGKIQTLSPKYGMIYLLRQYSARDCIWFSGKNDLGYYTEECINEAKDNAHVVHYAGDYFGRPWSFPKACKDNRMWLAYYKKTPWALEPVGKNHSLIDWLRHIIKWLAFPFVKRIWLIRTKKRFEGINSSFGKKRGIG